MMGADIFAKKAPTTNSSPNGPLNLPMYGLKKTL
jgi:hypothetical protein